MSIFDKKSLALVRHTITLVIGHVVCSYYRTAADFASAIDLVWPFFAGQSAEITQVYESRTANSNPSHIHYLEPTALGCKRTGKEDLIRMNIIQKAASHKGETGAAEGTARLSRFSRPGSSYVMAMHSLNPNGPPAKVGSSNHHTMGMYAMIIHTSNSLIIHTCRCPLHWRMVMS